MTKNYDLCVAYRLYPGISAEAPSVFGNDKQLLAAVALRSFAVALAGLKVKVYVLLDNCPQLYRDLFSQFCSSMDVVFEDLPGVGNRATFMRQLEILSAQNDSDYVLFAEDDYFYLPGAFNEILRLMRTYPERVDFVTPYDHLDYSTLPLHRHRQEEIEFSGRRWKTVCSTTCTFLTTKATLLAAKRCLETYYQPLLFNKMTDLGVWLSLTKHRVFNPINFAYAVFRQPFWGWSWFCSWLLNWRQLFLGPRYRLWCPEPSLATHLVTQHLAPQVAWHEKIAAGLGGVWLIGKEGE